VLSEAKTGREVLVTSGTGMRAECRARGLAWCVRYLKMEEEETCVSGGGTFIGEMEARMGRDSRPNRCWPNHHRDFFAFGTEKRDEELCGGMFDR
jgi:hypothetical protein